jgi:glutamate-5-semialdehyde dehydrogenase
MAVALEMNAEAILDANARDMAYANEAALSDALKDRLFLDRKRIGAMAEALEEIAALKNPVGRILDGWVNPNGLKIEKVSVPIGVIGVIYESRPNVTSDVAALCFKSGNIAILKGGKEAAHSNEAIAVALQEVLIKHGLPKEAVAMLPDSSREGVDKLIKMDRYIDLIIPRGGEALIRHVSENATVPVVKHDKGLCHIFVEKSADLAKATPILINAKTQRPGVCNAMETLLVDKELAALYLPEVKKAFDAKGTQLRGCSETLKFIDVRAATEEDWDTEYLDNILSIRVVGGVEEAIAHIARHGSGHSDAILSENYHAIERFLNEVDSAAVYANASTRFTDGAAFGFGAEVGISTNKLHARGPMGINDLTTYKFKLTGNGQIRES